MNLIRNNAVATEEMQLAEKACGTDLGGTKSKSTRCKPVAVKIQFTTMPDELLQANVEITLSIDGLNVNGLEFLTTITHEEKSPRCYYCNGKMNIISVEDRISFAQRNIAHFVMVFAVMLLEQK